MEYSAAATLETQKALEAAIDNQDFPSANAAYLAFLKQFASFRSAYAGEAGDVPVGSPIFGAVGFYLKQTTDKQAQEMLARARAASQPFGTVPVAERLELLQFLEEGITKYQDAIMTTFVADTGKPMDLAKGEMQKANEWFNFAREQAEAQLGNMQVKALLNFRKPLGAVQVIGAYNYPLALAIGGIVGGLVAGDGVIVSAPLKAPNWVFPFMEAAQEAVGGFLAKAKTEGKPWAEALAAQAAGVIQVNTGVNHVLTEQADVVHFVGSDQTGNRIRASRGGKPTILEMGGGNVVTVMKSALEKLPAEKIAQSIYGGVGPATGQRCTAPRILGVQTGAEAVNDALFAICDKGPAAGDIGNPFREGVKMGPLVDAGAYQAMQRAIALAHELGADVHGTLDVRDNVMPLSKRDKAYWVNPITIDWSGVMHDEAKRAKVQACLKHEIFGPLVHVIQPVATLEEAIAQTNALDDHGLAAAIFTNQPDDAVTFSQQVRATSIALNGPPKDVSPKGVHGHPGETLIGGHDHFLHYSRGSGLMDWMPSA